MLNDQGSRYQKEITIIRGRAGDYHLDGINDLVIELFIHNS